MPLLHERGFSELTITFASSLIGPAQVGSRIALLATRRYFSMETIGIITVSALPLSLALLLVLPQIEIAPCLMLVLYGTANGLVTILRGTAIPDLIGSEGYGSINGIPGCVSGCGAKDRRPWGRDAAELNDARMATSRPDFQYTFHYDCGKKRKWVLIRVEGRNSQNLRPGQVFPDGPPSGSEASPVQTPCTEIPRVPPRTPTRAFTVSFHCRGVRGSSGLEVGSGSSAAVLSYGRHGRTTPTTGPDGALALHGSRASLLTAC